MTEHLQRNPSYEKREGEALTRPGNPLTNLTTIKLSRKKFRKLQAERVWKVCFARFIQSSIYPPWPNPQWMHLTCTITRSWVCCADWKLSSQGWCTLVWCCYLNWWSGLEVVIWLSGGRVVKMALWPYDLGSDLTVWCGGLMDWFHGLIWSCAWGRWSGLTAENWKDRKLS